jgi:hypothetical protein
VPDDAAPDQLSCEDTLPTTGRRCRELASIVVVRFGGEFKLCAACALRDYFLQFGVNGTRP